MGPMDVLTWRKTFCSQEFKPGHPAHGQSLTELSELSRKGTI
jgi:hypothetical protein